MSVIVFASYLNGGLSEIRGQHLTYSKFWNANPTGKKQMKLSSRTSMLLCYTPFLAALASFYIFPPQGVRSTFLQAAITLHFFKRLSEVLFVHKYSGWLEEPPVDLLYPGIVLFVVGIIGNFYHHCLLSKLRGNGEKENKIPKGGLFGFVICPHYLFEIIIFYGISFVSQTPHGFTYVLGVTFLLMGRSYATRKWYLSKFEDFPEHVKAVIPFVF
ncbi:hypothetical protein Fmac_016132 [Flemingia macrophylla]|uniref:3-oxo-5-alpha-steroid 4-dehydrogenase C-terminal domain-containing protein n=1 Tax=Flemingia macrophylla TaxID=520843 RepID=A0ABD1MGI4_9FABA